MSIPNPPSITQSPDWPTRNDSANFNSKADAVAAYMEGTYTPELQAALAWIKARGDEIYIKTPNVVGNWVTATAYSQNQIFTSGGQQYVVLQSHTSTSISADLAAGKIVSTPNGYAQAAIEYLLASKGVTSTGAPSQLVDTLNTNFVRKEDFRATQLGLPFRLWNLNGQSLVIISDGKVGDETLRMGSSGGARTTQGSFVAINPSRKYRVRFLLRPSATCDGYLLFSLRQFLDSSGATPGPSNEGRSPYKPSGQTRAAHIATYGDTWGEYSYIWDSADWQTGAKYVQPEFLNIIGATGYWEIQDFRFEDITEVEAARAYAFTVATTPATTSTIGAVTLADATAAGAGTSASLVLTCKALYDAITSATSNALKTAIAALGASKSLGNSSQTYQDVTSSRVSGTTYTNPTGTPIQVWVQSNTPGSNTTLTVDGVGVSIGGGDNNNTHTNTATVKSGSAYSYSGSFFKWVELR